MDDQALVNLLLASAPSDVVLVGEPVFRLASVLHDMAHSGEPPQVSKCPSIETFVSARDAVGRDSNECVMCLDLPDDVEHADVLLGLGCRTAPRLLLVEHSASTAEAQLLNDQRFFAFGFRALEKTADATGLQRHWYAYSLSDYKQSPDWLNARFWAHPERFDLQD